MVWHGHESYIMTLNSWKQVLNWYKQVYEIHILDILCRLECSPEIGFWHYATSYSVIFTNNPVFSLWINYFTESHCGRALCAQILIALTYLYLHKSFDLYQANLTHELFQNKGHLHLQWLSFWLLVSTAVIPSHA